MAKKKSKKTSKTKKPILFALAILLIMFAILKALNKSDTAFRNNSVLSVGGDYLFAETTIDGKQPKSFGGEVLLEAEDPSVRRERISPDRKKMIFSYDGNSKENRIFDKTYVMDFVSSSSMLVDLDSVKKEIGDEFSFNIWGWSSDSNEVLITARNIKEFVPGTEHLCCEGADFRESQQIIFSYNVVSKNIKELHRFTGISLQPKFYDPEKNYLVYLLNTDEDAMVEVNLLNAEEKYFDLQMMLPGSGQENFIVASDSKSLKTFSYYDLSKPIATIDVDLEGRVFTNTFTWSPSGEKFMISIRSEDNATYPITYRVYDVYGKIISKLSYMLPNSKSSGVIFSENEEYLIDYSYDWSGANGGYSWIVSDFGKNKEISRVKSSENTGRPLIWNN